MAKLKLNKWVTADRVRLVKKNGVKHLEVRRTVKKRAKKRR